MLTDQKKKEIFEKAQKINLVSDEYQLIHATFALEKISNETLKSSYERNIAKLREKIRKEVNPEKLVQLFEEVKDLREARRQKKIRISVIYLKEIDENSARTTRTQNTYMILLPEGLKAVRNEDGSINLEKLKKLRHLMAHELGHIYLHSELIMKDDSDGTALFKGEQEEEADYFAEQLIMLRRKRNDELYKDGNYAVI